MKQSIMLAYPFLQSEENSGIALHSLINHHGTKVVIMNYGATVLSIECIDSHGHLGDILLGYNHLDGYKQPSNPYMNCIIGRYANRIQNGQFAIDNHVYQLTHNLHGGKNGFDKKLWKVIHADINHIIMEYISEDGEEGFPGTLHCTLQYELDDDNAFHIVYKATTTKACPVNLTNHCYFNLSAGKEANIYNHELQILSNAITELDNHQIPTGQFIDVRNSVFDLNIPKNLGHQLSLIDGYDHNWVVGSKKEKPQKVGTLSHHGSGRSLTVWTTEPGLQIYTANGWTNTQHMIKHQGTPHGNHCGICLEAQLFPDSPNHPTFPNSILQAGELYHQHTIYQMDLI